MTWQGAPRTGTAEWKQTRLRVLARDRYRCQIIVDGALCGAPANEVDHVQSHAECVRLGVDPDVDANLRSICDPHHRAKSSAEGNAEQARRRTARRRPAERHPGARP